MASPVSNLVPHTADGRIRIIAIAAPQRLGGTLAQTPTFTEQGVKVDVDSLRGIVGPKGMTAAQVAYWEDALKKMTETKDWRSNLEKRLWVDSFTGAEGSRRVLKAQYDEVRAGMAELGLAKN
jgi:putative tricarboxylic transport membrane protein